MKSKKSIVIIIVVIVVVGIIIALGVLGSKTNNTVSKYGGINTNIKTCTATFEGKNIGKYQETTYNAANTSNEQIFNFYNDVIKPKLAQDNYFMLIDGNQCIVFGSAMGDSIQKCTYNNKTGFSGNWEENGIIKNNTIEWTKNPIQNS